MEMEEEGGGSGPHSELSGVNNEKFNQEKKEEVEDHSPGDPHSELSGVNNEKFNQEREEEEEDHSPGDPPSDLSGVNNDEKFNQVYIVVTKGGPGTQGPGTRTRIGKHSTYIEHVSLIARLECAMEQT